MSKAPRILDPLGPDVKISNVRIPKDTEMKLRLQGLGELMQVMLPADNFEYSGSMVTHIYLSNGMKKSAFFLHDHTFPKPVSENLVSAAMADKAAHLMEEVFGRKKQATRDPKDQRGKGKL